MWSKHQDVDFKRMLWVAALQPGSTVSNTNYVFMVLYVVS